MRVCCCSLAGTNACIYCSNGSMDYGRDSLVHILRELNNQSINRRLVVTKSEWKNHSSNPKRVVTNSFTTTHL